MMLRNIQVSPFFAFLMLTGITAMLDAVQKKPLLAKDIATNVPRMPMWKRVQTWLRGDRNPCSAESSCEPSGSDDEVTLAFPLVSSDSNPWTAADVLGFIRDGAVAYLEHALDRGQSPNLLFAGRTLLHWAVGQDQLEILKLLLKYGANPNKVDYLGYTPIFYAIATREPITFVQVLLYYGADTNQVNNDGRTVVDVARSRGGEIIKILEQARASAQKKRLCTLALCAETLRLEADTFLCSDLQLAVSKFIGLNWPTPQ